MYNSISNNFSNNYSQNTMGQRPPRPHRHHGMDGQQEGVQGQRPPGKRGGGFKAQIQEGIQNGTISSTEAEQLRAPGQEMKAFKQQAMAVGRLRLKSTSNSVHMVSR